MYKIPKIIWQITNHGAVTTAETKNTFIEYSIKVINHEVYCFYGNGRHKIFKTLSDAREWVEFTHYPAQVNKYLDKVD